MVEYANLWLKYILGGEISYFLKLCDRTFNIILPYSTYTKLYIKKNYSIETINLVTKFHERYGKY